MSAIYFLVKIIVSVVVLSVISTSEVSNAPAKLLDVSKDSSFVLIIRRFSSRPFLSPDPGKLYLSALTMISMAGGRGGIWTDTGLA